MTIKPPFSWLDPQVVDVCGGHGALALLFLAHGQALRATVIDPNQPASHGTLRTWDGDGGGMGDTMGLGMVGWGLGLGVGVGDVGLGVGGWGDGAGGWGVGMG